MSKSDKDQEGNVWAAVEEALGKGKPQTALAALEEIERGADAEREPAVWLRAVLWAAELRAQREDYEKREAVAMREIEGAIERAPERGKPLLRLALALRHMAFAEGNRWKIYERTALSGEPGADMETWDLETHQRVLLNRLEAALAEEGVLRGMAAGEFEGLLTKGTAPDGLRPTLWEFAAHKALECYGALLTRLAKPDGWRAGARSAAFGEAGEFLAWEIPAGGEGKEGVWLAGLRLCRRLMRGAAGRPELEAEADFARIGFLYEAAEDEGLLERGGEGFERFGGLVRGFVERHAGLEVMARASLLWAEKLREAGELEAAHDMAARAAEAFPGSPAGVACGNLVRQIEAPTLEVEAPKLWARPFDPLRVRRRNIREVHARLARLERDEALRLEMEGWTSDEDKTEALLAREPVAVWKQAVEEGRRFDETTVEVAVPEGLEPGAYLAVVSESGNFDRGSCRGWAVVWVSDLAAVVSELNGKPVIRVARAGSGEPVAGARIRFLSVAGDGKPEVRALAETDSEGLAFAPKSVIEHPWKMAGGLIESRGEMAFLGKSVLSSLHPWRLWPERKEQRTFFFLDRAIYRPGQTARFKAVLGEFDRERGDYKALAGRGVTIALLDANDQEIGRRSLRANAFGSVSGEFELPEGRGTGVMKLMVKEGPEGRAHFRVEEYKRPTFEVELEAPAEGAELGGRVVVRGKAAAYTGVPVAGAKVGYRVARKPLLPPWWWWFWRGPGLEETRVASGEAVTDTEGRFEIAFEAADDPAAQGDGTVSYEFEVAADVTDAAGETRTGRRVVTLGRRDVMASLSAEEWQTSGEPVRMRVELASLDGAPRPGRGVVRVYRLQEPERVERPAFEERASRWPVRRGGEQAEAERHPTADWPLGEAVFEKEIETGGDGKGEAEARLGAGVYRAVFEAADSKGRRLAALLPLTVLDAGAERFGARLPYFFAVKSPSVEPGGEFEAVWGTGYESGRAFVEFFHKGRRVAAYWTKPGVTQQRIAMPVTEAHRGGIGLRLTFVRENRLYVENRVIDVPWTNKRMPLEWETFRSKLEPGVKEKWALRAGGGTVDLEREGVEVVAALYDASLDAFVAHGWGDFMRLFRAERAPRGAMFANGAAFWRVEQRNLSLADVREWVWRDFDERLGIGFATWRFDRFRGVMRSSAPVISAMAMNDGPPAAMAAPGSGPPGSGLPAAEGVPEEKARGGGASVTAAAPPPDLDGVTARANLQETAFFLPHLTADEKGRVVMEFEMPEALTRWNFLAFAHDRALRNGVFRDTVVTAKDLMIQPFVPRFLREGDEAELVVKAVNRTDRPLAGRVRLELRNAETGEAAGRAFGVEEGEREFEAGPNETVVVGWRVRVPEGAAGAVIYKAVGAAGAVSDGEEGVLPVLARRVLVRESLPLPVRGEGERVFRFGKLADSGAAAGLRHEKLVLQMTPNPVWYAVMALPQLMEFPHECSEQVFNRLYANLLARHIARSDKRIEEVFERWRGTAALDSPLEKNADLRAVAIEETPWLAEAKSESAQRRRVADLFEPGRAEREIRRAADKLRKARLGSGLWPWFPGGEESEFISLYIAAGFGKLRAMGVDLGDARGFSVKELAESVIPAADKWLERWYRELAKEKRLEGNNLSPALAFYLYARSFFFEENRPKGEAFEYLVGQARAHWLELGDRQSQGHIALALNRLEKGDATARLIAESLVERSVLDAEMGRFWRDGGELWWWWRAPIETQAVMIEVFDEVLGDAGLLEECQTWLLKQKQTQAWPTTKATADAVYALMRGGGAARLRDDVLVEVVAGGQRVEPETVEAGTGFFEKRWAAGEITPALGEIVVRKRTPGVAWGALHWQYLEEPERITPPAEGPLRIEKGLFVRRQTGRGAEMEAVSGPVKLGDEVVTRLVLRADRDIEFVHVKDGRSAGVEPAEALSGWQVSGRLVFYRSVRDTATHLFVERLPRGTHVIELAGRAAHRGAQRTGLAEAGCMYAPEFNAHAPGPALEIR